MLFILNARQHIANYYLNGSQKTFLLTKTPFYQVLIMNLLKSIDKKSILLHKI